MLHPVGAEQVARRLGVEVAVGQVEAARLLHPLARGHQVLRVLAEARLEGVRVRVRVRVRLRVRFRFRVRVMARARLPLTLTLALTLKM